MSNTAPPAKHGTGTGRAMPLGGQMASGSYNLGGQGFGGERPWFANQRVVSPVYTGGDAFIPVDGSGAPVYGSVNLSSSALPWWFNPLSAVDRVSAWPIQQALSNFLSPGISNPFARYGDDINQ
jgi:hypothetical protein